MYLVLTGTLLLALLHDATSQAMIAVGHPASAEALPDPLREREVPSPRKALDELMFNGDMS